VRLSPDQITISAGACSQSCRQRRVRFHLMLATAKPARRIAIAQKTNLAIGAEPPTGYSRFQCRRLDL
jgi:hypothetical protein